MLWCYLLTLFVALVGYALYDFVTFNESLQEGGTILNTVLNRVGTLSDWEGYDCSISDTIEFAGANICSCDINPGTGVWECSANREVSPPPDCHITATPFCSCKMIHENAIYLDSTALLPLWTCEKVSFDTQFEANSTLVQEDLGLRFLPPGFSDQVPSSSSYFSNVPPSVASFDTFYFVFAEPVPNTTPITTVLLVSLIFDVIGLVSLCVGALFILFRKLDFISPETGKFECCKTRRIRIFTIIDFFFLFAGLILFGVVLIVAYTNPLFNEPQTLFQRAELKNNIDNMARSFKRSGQLSDPSVCKCPFEYESTNCVAGNGVIAFAGDTVLKERNVVFSCNVTVTGSLQIEEQTGFQRSLSVNGLLRIGAAILVEGSVSVTNGNVMGEAWELSFPFAEAFKIGGDLLIENGSLMIDNSTSDSVANLGAVQGSIQISNGGLEYGGSKWLLSMESTSTRNVIHTSSSLSVPPRIELNVTGEFPFSSWQDVTFPLASSDTALVGQSSIVITDIDWRYMRRMYGTGACGAVTNTRSTLLPGAKQVFATFRVRCSGTPLIGLPETPYQPAVASLSFPPSADRYAVVGAPQNFDLTFAFNVTNCKGEMQYRRERDWIQSLSSAGFGDW